MHVEVNEYVSELIEGKKNNKEMEKIVRQTRGNVFKI